MDYFRYNYFIHWNYENEKNGVWKYSTHLVMKGLFMDELWHFIEMQLAFLTHLPIFENDTNPNGICRCPLFVESIYTATGG